MLRREIEQSLGHADPAQERGARSILAALDLAESQGFKDRSVVEAAAGIREYLLNTSAVATPEPEQIVNPQDELLKQAVVEYKKGLTPDSVTKFWRAMLPDLSIPECDWTVEAIRSPMKDINGQDVAGILVPDIDEITLPGLGRRYPNMANDAVRESTPITDVHDTRGYVKVYASVDAPNRDTTQPQLEEFAQKQGYLGGRLRTYILTSQAIKVLSGKYLDQGDTWVRLLGSRRGGYVVSAYFGSGGILYVHWGLFTAGNGSGLGGRFEKMKRT